MKLPKLETWNEAQLDWMRHLIRLNKDRVEKPEGLNVHAVNQLKWEIEAQETILARLSVRLPLDDFLVVMAHYMQVYANLHIHWYSRKLGDQEFREAVLAAKKQMREGIRVLKIQMKEGVR